MAEAVGVSVDLASDAWADKSVNAYLSYITENMHPSNPTSYYQYGQALENLTGYNVVYNDGDKFYLNTPEDSTGGAFYRVECTPTNLGSLSNVMMQWVRYAANNGPEWPNNSSGGGGNVGQGGNFYIVYEAGISSPYVFPDGSTINFDQSSLNNYNTGLSGNNVFILETKGNNNGSTTTYTFQVSKATSNIYISENRAIVYNESQFNGSSQVYQGIVNEFGCPEDGYYKLINGLSVYRYCITNCGIGNAINVPNEPDNTPPSSTPERPTIQWPDITLPSLPDFSITNNYPTTSGDIDFTPITQRLDAINENLEKFYVNFNLYWSDFMQYWDAMGDALDGLDARLWDLSLLSRDVIAWLRNIYDMLGASAGNVQGDIYEINNYYQPEVDEGNTPQQQLDTDITRLKGKFPFSVPWDLYALLQFLQAPAVAPVFTFTLPYMGTLTCDLSILDDVAAVCRWASLFAFGAGLVYKTKDILEYVTGMTIGFGGNNG